MPKVYVIEEPKGKNISSASRFGDLEVLLPDSEITFSTGLATRLLKRRLMNFTNDDFLLLIGNPISIGLCVGMALRLNNGKAKLLKWDNQDKLYYPIDININ